MHNRASVLENVAHQLGWDFDIQADHLLLFRRPHLIIIKKKKEKKGEHAKLWTLMFHLTTEWYMHNPEPVLENDTHKLLWDFDIQTDHLILAR